MAPHPLPLACADRLVVAHANVTSGRGESTRVVIVNSERQASYPRNCRPLQRNALRPHWTTLKVTASLASPAP